MKSMKQSNNTNFLAAVTLQVPRTKTSIDADNGFGPMGRCGNRLRSTHTIDFALARAFEQLL